MKFAVMSLGELLPDPDTGRRISPQQRLAEIVEMAVSAEELGFDSFATGEHHGLDLWSVSAPPVVLAAVAARTERIRLRTGVTVMPNLDPVRVAEDYATVDLLSGGRLELTVGKGNFPQPWEVFGQDPEDQRERLSEAVDLLRLIWQKEPSVTWQGRFRPPLTDAIIVPQPLQSPPPIWWGVSTAAWSADFAAERGLPIVLGGVAQSTDHYGALADHYRESYAAHGYDPETAEVGTVSHVYVRRDGDQARREFKAYHEATMKLAEAAMRLGSPIISDYEERLAGPLVVGSPEEVAEKILSFHDRYQHQLHFLQCDMGGQSLKSATQTMELLAAEVIPMVERELRGAPQVLH
jgi:alkanesulfonate monooxygenase SsuD/methylene tetrahydromethanopterin reductase-like flavin-dependent oxidoreductase (luciferase family)